MEWQFVTPVGQAKPRAVRAPYCASNGLARSCRLALATVAPHAEMCAFDREQLTAIRSYLENALGLRLLSRSIPR